MCSVGVEQNSDSTDKCCRWVTGLKTINFSSIVLSNSSGAGLDGIEISGEFANLPASIHIGEQLSERDRERETGSDRDKHRERQTAPI